MNRSVIESRVQQLTEELRKAEDELVKLRPRVQYLEAILQRTDGALTVLQGLLAEPEPQAPPPAARAQSDSEFAPGWPQPVAP